MNPIISLSWKGQYKVNANDMNFGWTFFIKNINANVLYIKVGSPAYTVHLSSTVIEFMKLFILGRDYCLLNGKLKGPFYVKKKKTPNPQNDLYRIDINGTNRVNHAIFI